MSIVLNWNGAEIPNEVRQRMPAELRDLPRGRYVIEAIDQAPVLTDEEDAGIHAALESVRRGEGVSLDEARAHIDRLLGR
jgi:predicted transcriptional regulator